VTLLGQGVGLGDPQRSLPTPAILGFCGLFSSWPRTPTSSGWARAEYYLVLCFLIKKKTRSFSLPCECWAVIPAPLPCSGRGRWSPALRARPFSGSGPLGMGRGWKGAGREQLRPVPGVLGELRVCVALCKCTASVGHVPAAPCSGPGWGCSSKSLAWGRSETTCCLFSFYSFSLFFFFFFLLQSEAPGWTPLALAEGRKGAGGWLCLQLFGAALAMGRLAGQRPWELPGRCRDSWLRAFFRVVKQS